MKLKFYITMAIFMIAIGGTSVYLEMSGNEPDASLYPYMDAKKRWSEYRTLEATATGRVRTPDNAKSEKVVAEKISTPEQYFNLQLRRRNLEWGVRRALYGGQNDKMMFAESDPLTKARDQMIMASFLEIDNGLYAQAPTKDPTAFIKAREAFEKKAKIYQLPTRERDPRLALFWPLFYFGSMAFAIAHYGIRLKDMEMSLVLETGNLRFWLWVFLWPIGLFKYPVKADAYAQLQRAYRFSVFALSSCISLFATGCGPKKVETQPHGKRPVAAWHLEASTMTWPKYVGLDGAVFHPGPVQQTNLRATHPSGAYANLWLSEPICGPKVTPNFGWEVDVAAGWSGKKRGLMWNGQVNYIDVTPQFRFRGNVVELSSKVGKPVKLDETKSLMPYGWARYVFPVRDGKPVGDLFLHGGVAFDWQISPRFGLSALGDLEHDPGAFGYRPGLLARAGGTLSARLSKRWSAQFPVIFSQPLTTGDRRTELLFGGGLAFAIR